MGSPWNKATIKMSPAVNDTVTLWGDQSQLWSNSYNSLDYNIHYVQLYSVGYGMCIFYCPVLKKNDFYILNV